MARTSAALLIVFAIGFLTAVTTMSGCSRAANRTLTIFQFQSPKTYGGKFRVDTSELPSSAIEVIHETGGPGSPLTRIELNIDYEIEVILRFAETD